MLKITGDQLRQVVIALSHERANDLAAIMNHCHQFYGDLTPKQFCAWLANVAHESGSFRIKKENLNYTTPERLVQVWPSRFSLTGTDGKKKAADYVRQPDKLANLVYGGRMGNTEPGDGAKYVGGGFPQITGKEAYQAYHDHLQASGRGSFTLEEVASMVQTNDTWAMDVAFWFFCVFKPQLRSIAETWDFKSVVKVWNGGLTNYQDRMNLYEKSKQVVL
jgi:putative chitinase